MTHPFPDQREPGPTDVRTVPFRTSAAEAVAAQVGPVSLRTARDLLPGTLATAGEYRRDGDGWTVAWHDALTPVAWPLTADVVARRVDSTRLLGDRGPLRPDEADGLLADLLTVLERREQTPQRAVSVLTVEEAVTARLVRGWAVWREDDGSAWWRARPRDPFGRLVGHVPVAEPGPTSFARRLGFTAMEPVAGAERVDAAAVRRACEIGGLVQLGERPDWAVIAERVRAAAGPRPPA